MARPAVELSEAGESGRRYLVIVGQLVEELDRVGEAATQALARTGGYAVQELLEERMPPMEEALRRERLALVTSFIVRTVADRARAMTSVHPGRAQLPTEQFVANLVAMCAGMIQAPAG